MNSSRLLVHLGLASAIAGCTSTTAIRDPFFAKLTTNVGAGNFQQYDFPFRLPPDGRDKTVFVARFETLRPSETWAPVVSVCLQGQDPRREQVCLSLSVSQDGKKITPQRYERSSVSDAEPRRQYFDDVDFQSGEFTILLEQVAGAAKFYLNGTAVFESTHVSSPTRFGLFCSSAVCTFSLADGGA
jgi:hypothetical protein